MSYTRLFAWMMIILAIGLVGCTTTASSITTDSSLPASITIAAAKQGVIASDKTPIPIEEFFHEITAPKDSDSGLASGKIQHKELRITKELDATSPKLMSALTTNEKLPSVKIVFTKPDKKGTNSAYYLIELKDAYLSDIHQYTDENDTKKVYEDVAFTYKSITGTYLDADNATNGTNTTSGSGGAGDAPFHISVNPATVTIAKGENIKYTILIEADKEFNDPVNLTLDLDAPLLGSHYELGTFGPGYPYQLNYTMLVPTNIPLGFDITGTMTATSGPYKTSTPVEVHISGPAKFIGNSLNWLASIPDKIGAFFTSAPEPAPSGKSFTANWNS